MLNGDGLRVVLWVSGCDHFCKGCQNPVTWDASDGLIFDEAAKREIFEQLEKPYISGITFSGGDPLYSGNRTEVELLLRELKQHFPQKTIWLYTGDCWENICGDALMQYIDVLVDGEFQLDKQDQKLLWKGSKNQRVIDVQTSLHRGIEKPPVLHCGDYAG